jgi:hypothetical protein
MKWYLFQVYVKSTKGFYDETFQMFFEDESKEIIENSYKKWAESLIEQDYFYKFDRIASPSIDWLKKQIEKSKVDIIYIKEIIKIYKKQIKIVKGKI